MPTNRNVRVLCVSQASSKDIPTAASFAIAGSSGISAWMFVHPMDVVKVKNALYVHERLSRRMRIVQDGVANRSCVCTHPSAKRKVRCLTIIIALRINGLLCISCACEGWASCGVGQSVVWANQCCRLWGGYAHAKRLPLNSQSGNNHRLYGYSRDVALFGRIRLSYHATALIEYLRVLRNGLVAVGGERSQQLPPLPLLTKRRLCWYGGPWCKRKPFGR